MNDALLMRSFKSFGNLLGDGERFLQWNRPAGDSIGKCFAFDEFHHQRWAVTRFLDVVNRRDIRMIQ